MCIICCLLIIGLVGRNEEVSLQIVRTAFITVRSWPFWRSADRSSTRMSFPAAGPYRGPEAQPGRRLSRSGCPGSCLPRKPSGNRGATRPSKLRPHRTRQLLRRLLVTGEADDRRRQRGDRAAPAAHNPLTVQKPGLPVGSDRTISMFLGAPVSAYWNISSNVFVRMNVELSPAQLLNWLAPPVIGASARNDENPSFDLWPTPTLRYRKRSCLCDFGLFSEFSSGGDLVI